MKKTTKKAPKSLAKTVADAGLLRLDLGCGPNKIHPSWMGVDSRKFEGVDVVLDLSARVKGKFKPWPWKTSSVHEVHSSHFVEHLQADERIHFVNELYRILVPGGSAKIITPHWASSRAYGDLTHAWPPVSEFWFFYLSKQWRADNAPHNDAYTCDFVAPTFGYTINPALGPKNEDYRNFAMAWYKEAAQDIVATLVKPG